MQIHLVQGLPLSYRKKTFKNLCGSTSPLYVPFLPQEFISLLLRQQGELALRLLSISACLLFQIMSYFVHMETSPILPATLLICISA